MTLFNFYLFFVAALVALLVLGLNRSRTVNDPSKIVEDSGNTLVVRQTLFARMLKLSSKSVNKQDVVKLQRSDGCLSVFLKSDNAYDIWVSERHLDKVVDHVRNLLPHAEYVEIKSR